jgi:hypothetical protein
VRRLFSSIGLTLMLGAVLSAASMVALPPGMDLIALPGSTALWSVEVTNDTGYMVPTSFQYLTLDPAGSFTDIFLSLFVVVGPGGTLPVLGPYDIDAAATPGFVSVGKLMLSYDLFSVDPNDPLFNPDTDLMTSGNTLDLDASVKIQDAGEVPEPATGALLGLALACLALRGRR